MTKPETDKHKYRDTLLLPKTAFPMKAGLPQLEKTLLARWDKMSLYSRLREDAKARPPFILHDGPPYANGAVHLGTALNKILKDVVNRSQQMMGRNAVYVPGWDCHGLPIEWQVEEKHRAKGVKKEDIPREKLRKECRDFALHWIGAQRAQFQRLGVIGDWENPYLTMSPEAEARIVETCLHIAMQGALYRSLKPVMWSVVEKTALAEAEVEYRERVSETVFVRFPVAEGLDGKPASLLIWTTTPWTLPGNRAVAFSKRISYGIYEARGERIIIADKRASAVAEAGECRLTRLGEIRNPEALTLRHPFHGEGYDFPVPVLKADFVADDAGTGFVHIAPGHGRDDFELGAKHQLETPDTLDDEGVFRASVPLFAGCRVMDKKGGEGDANQKILNALKTSGALFAKGKLRHDYPHSWRSKAPVIFRATPQWFISMEKDGLRQKALREIAKTVWHPKQGERRLASMVESRPDWVVSRQRVWGVPLTLFVHEKSRALLRDEAVNARIVQAVREKGSDAWFETPAREFLGSRHDPKDWRKVEDILDVWFESGATHRFVLEDRADLRLPASLYLEGSDQHRGWFQSSLLLACARGGGAPYEAVLTHGFVLDGEGRKMSKSLGNSVDVMEIADRRGAELIRLWIASADATEDMRFSEEIMKSMSESYRKIRNGFRFLLGNLDGFSEKERLPYDEMPELERWILHRLSERGRAVHHAYQTFHFQRVMQETLSLITMDLSSLYFDIRKDALYCDSLSSSRRRACRSVLDSLFSCLSAWLAPVLAFTAEEAWLARHDAPAAAHAADSSVHLRLFPEIPKEWQDKALDEKWRRILEIRQILTAALEEARKAGAIGSSLDAAAEIYLRDEKDARILKSVDMAEIAITSQCALRQASPPQEAFRLESDPDLAVLVKPARGKRCQRSWKILPEVGTIPDYPDLSRRDAESVQRWRRAR